VHDDHSSFQVKFGFGHNYAFPKELVRVLTALAVVEFSRGFQATANPYLSSASRQRRLNLVEHWFNRR